MIIVEPTTDKEKLKHAHQWLEGPNIVVSLILNSKLAAKSTRTRRERNTYITAI